MLRASQYADTRFRHNLSEILSYRTARSASSATAIFRAVVDGFFAVALTIAAVIVLARAQNHAAVHFAGPSILTADNGIAYAVTALAWIARETVDGARYRVLGTHAETITTFAGISIVPKGNAVSCTIAYVLVWDVTLFIPAPRRVVFRICARAAVSRAHIAFLTTA